MTSISGNTPEKQEPLSRRVIRAELVGSDTCIACSISVTAAAPVLALCKALVEGGKDPSDSLEAFLGRHALPPRAEHRGGCPGRNQLQRNRPNCPARGARSLAHEEF